MLCEQLVLGCICPKRARWKHVHVAVWYTQTVGRGGVSDQKGLKERGEGDLWRERGTGERQRAV